MGCGMGGRWWLSGFKRIVFVFYNIILLSGCIPGDGKSPIGEMGCGMGRRWWTAENFSFDYNVIFCLAATR